MRNKLTIESVSFSGLDSPLVFKVNDKDGTFMLVNMNEDDISDFVSTIKKFISKKINNFEKREIKQEK